MSVLLNRLTEQLKARGLSVEPGPDPGTLLLCGPAAEKTPEVVAAVKVFKPELLALAGAVPRPAPAPEPEAAPRTVCRRCGRSTDAENRERLRGPNPFCDEPKCPHRGTA